MPDPLLYAISMVKAATASAIFVLAMLAVRKAVSKTWLNATCVAGIAFGLVIGYYLLSLQTSWPPTNGLERLLTIVLPATLGIELIAGIRGMPSKLVWMLRIILAITVPRILLHGSVYLSGSGAWTLLQIVAAMALCSVSLAFVWMLMSRLSLRSPGVSIPLALSLSILCAGATVMMAGYIKGGAAALPLVATLPATAIAATLCRNRIAAQQRFDASAVIGIGVVGLFGVLFIGRFFGEISTAAALTMLLAPLLCWATEMPFFQPRRPWLLGSVRLLLVAIPLAIVLVDSKRNFDRDMSPLLSSVARLSQPIILDQCGSVVSTEYPRRSS